MAKDYTSKRENRNECVDPPKRGKHIDATYHDSSHDDSKAESPFETLDDEGKFDIEGSILDFFGCCSP
tara:strand:- start:26 stop:229 length:204 start_codon:yes stop_codon:yes gene_type:complete